MAISDIINASINKNYAPVKGSGGSYAPKNNNGISSNGNQTPTFGIKGKDTLTQDMFEYKGQKLTREETYEYFDDSMWFLIINLHPKYWHDSWRSV